METTTPELDRKRAHSCCHAAPGDASPEDEERTGGRAAEAALAKACHSDGPPQPAERLAPTKAAAATEYVCPMHPEVVRHAPGSCPICGMALEPRVASLGDGANPELTDMGRRFLVS